MSTLRFAIIDSNALSRDLLSSLLANGGHEVVGSSNTSAAGVARIIKLQPHAVCIDIGHKNTEGDEALSAVLTALPKTLVFMVSGTLDEEAVKNGAARGVRGFIVKPFNPKTVLATIHNTVVRAARQQQVEPPVS